MRVTIDASVDLIEVFGLPPVELLGLVEPPKEAA